MSSELQRVEQSVKSIEGLTDQFVSLTGGRIDQVNEALDHDIYTLELSIRLRVAGIEAILIPALTIVYQSAVYHTLRAYWHASPSLLAILAAIWAVVLVIWQIIKIIIWVVDLIKTLHLDDLLAEYWPAFEEARTKFRQWVGELSEAIGWGVDGLLHLLHATQGFTDVLGGLMGKTYTWMDAEWMVKTGNVLDKVSFYSNQITERPGEIMEILFQGEMRDSFHLSSTFGDDLMDKIRDGAISGTRALSDLRDVADELASIQEGMPDLIRQHIPPGIFDSLEEFSDVIDNQILPRIAQVERYVDLLDSIFDSHALRLGELANKLAHPGTNLLTIDDLPSYARDAEEWAIDNVASRKFGDLADAERYAMEGDLAAFAIIDAAATAPLPPPEFMTIELPQRAALHGIVAEPHETWFIGGYNDQL